MGINSHHMLATNRLTDFLKLVDLSEPVAAESNMSCIHVRLNDLSHQNNSEELIAFFAALHTAPYAPVFSLLNKKILAECLLSHDSDTLLSCLKTTNYRECREIYTWLFGTEAIKKQLSFSLHTFLAESLLPFHPIQPIEKICVSDCTTLLKDNFGLETPEAMVIVYDFYMLIDANLEKIHALLAEDNIRFASTLTSLPANNNNNALSPSILRKRRKRSPIMKVTYQDLLSIIKTTPCKVKRLNFININYTVNKLYEQMEASFKQGSTRTEPLSAFFASLATPSYCHLFSQFDKNKLGGFLLKDTDDDFLNAITYCAKSNNLEIFEWIIQEDALWERFNQGLNSLTDNSIKFYHIFEWIFSCKSEKFESILALFLLKICQKDIKEIETFLDKFDEMQAFATTAKKIILPIIHSMLMVNTQTTFCKK